MGGVYGNGHGNGIRGKTRTTAYFRRRVHLPLDNLNLDLISNKVQSMRVPGRFK
jgi:hypothetical protein